MDLLASTADGRMRPSLRGSLAPGAGTVVGHGERYENEEEEHRGDDDQLEQFFVSMPEVHEEKCDEERLYGGDGECDDGVESAEIDVCDLVRKERAHEQGDPHGEVGLERRRF